jgi:integrating conjugative element relaxase (TIGR03760 family)
MGVLGLFRRREVAPGATPAGLLEWQPAAALLADADRQAVLRQIKEAVGVPAGHFRELYQGLIDRFAEFVQLLPASENHHHAHAGGLLDHSLDVAQKAVSLRRGHLLPPGAEPEVVARESDRWTYAVFSAALLHDVGKAALLGEVERFAATGQSLGRWVAWDGAMQDTGRYRFRFAVGRRYEDYPLAGPFLARALVPEVAIGWLGSGGDLMSAWLAALGGDGERGGVVSEIVERADRLSVAASLGVEAGASPAVSRKAPLHARLVGALRDLIDREDLPINRRGAGGWVYADELYVVAKRGIDAMRSRLLAEGHTDIPARNERIMDELQQHRVCVANGERAIWTVRIRMGDFDQELTVLRFSLATIWPAEDRRPPATIGSVEVVGEETTVPVSPGAADTPAVTLVVPPVAADAVSSSLVPVASAVPAAAMRMPATTACPVDDGRAAEAFVPPDTDHVHTAAVPAEEAIEADAEDDAEPAGAAGSEGHLPAEPEAFITWLQQGIESGRLVLNQPNSLLHVVDEGLLIVSPRTFRVYAADGEGRNWEYVQRRFVRLRWNRWTQAGKGIFEYAVVGERKSSRLKGLVISDAERRFELSLPKPNPHLSRVSAL